MPNSDGTGPLGNGPFTGGGLGRGLGRRFFRRGSAIKECTCPECGYKEASERGIPCTEKKCPKCGATMRGINCI